MTGSFPLCSQHFLDVPSFAQRLGVSERTCRRIIRAGKIGIFRVEGSVRIPEKEIERYLADRFVPAVEVRRRIDPGTVESLVNIVVARRRGRPRIAGKETAA